MKTQDLEKAADATFKRVLGNPRDRNARIICANRTNSAARFEPKKLIKRAKKVAAGRARDFEEAMELVSANSSI